MLKLRLAPLVAIGLTAALAVAQEPTSPAASKPASVKAKSDATTAAPTVKRATAPARNTIARATPVPVATPVPKKPGFWERVFGKKKPTPAPATPTPAPVTKKKVVQKPRPKKPKPAVVDNDENASTPDRTAKVEPTKTAEESTPPSTTEVTPKPPTTKSGKGKSGAQRAENFPPSTDNADAEIVEKQKYDQAKAKAVADPKVQELRGKADSAASEDESRKALRAYNKAMFKRMKEIDPSIKDHVDRMEAAVMSRLGGE